MGLVCPVSHLGATSCPRSRFPSREQSKPRGDPQQASLHMVRPGLNPLRVHLKQARNRLRPTRSAIQTWKTSIFSLRLCLIRFIQSQVDYVCSCSCCSWTGKICNSSVFHTANYLNILSLPTMGLVHFSYAMLLLGSLGLSSAEQPDKADFTIVNGQIYTPGLAIIDAPQPFTPEGGGQTFLQPQRNHTQ
jgi:hypothetical protein